MAAVYSPKVDSVGSTPTRPVDNRSLIDEGNLSMSEEIQKSTWQAPSKRVAMILKSMGINYRGTAHSFWANNEADLEYIYQEFETKARELKSRYHPDRVDTGDAEKYKELVDSCDLMERQFEAHGAIKVSALQREERKEMREARSQARIKFRNNMIKTGQYVPRKRGPSKRPSGPGVFDALLDEIESEGVDILSPEDLHRRRKTREKAAWRHAEDNRTKERERNRAWRLANPPTEEQKQARLAYFRAYRKRPDRIVKEYRAHLAYREANPEKVAQWKKNYADKQKALGKVPKKRPWREYKRVIKGTPAYERRREYRREHEEKNRESINAKRRERYLALNIAARCKEPNLAAAA